METISRAPQQSPDEDVVSCRKLGAHPCPIAFVTPVVTLRADRLSGGGSPWFQGLRSGVLRDTESNLPFKSPWLDESS